MSGTTIGDIVIGILLAEFIMLTLREGLHRIATRRSRRAVQLWQGHVRGN